MHELLGFRMSLFGFYFLESKKRWVYHFFCIEEFVQSNELRKLIYSEQSDTE